MRRFRSRTHLIALVAGVVIVGMPGRSAAQNPPRRDTLSDSARAVIQRTTREARAEARRREQQDTAGLRLRAEAAAATAFVDENARHMLERARIARLRQDSALRSYRAKATQRISLSVGVRSGLQKLLFRGDNVAMVSWQRGVGVWVNPIGSRMTVPLAGGSGAGTFYDAVSVPYFPGREQLWFPSSEGMVRADIDETEIIHPIARGAEVYYRYETGDSVDIRLGDGRVIPIRELKVTARRPEWRLFVGSFWFDRESGQLVRAAYRLAVDLEIWDIASEEAARDRDINALMEVVRDSMLRERLPREEYVRDSVRRARAIARGDLDEDDPPAWVKAIFRPAKARLDGVTIEYGLYEERFWLPRSQSAIASANVGFLRAPLEIHQKYDYEYVNGDAELKPLPPDSSTQPGRADTIVIVDDSEVSVTIGVGKTDSARAADARFRQDSLRAARLGQTCTRDTTYVRVTRRHDGQLRVAYEVPCDSEKLRTSPELPPVFASNEAVFDEKARDELLELLDLSLQPGWAPERPHVRVGLDLTRYNRVEGLSVGVLGTQRLGSGYSLAALFRIGHADLHPNGEFSVERSNGRRVVRGTIYHRMSAMNPEWAGALGWAASMPALLYSRDEGFYFRNYGVELTDRRELGTRLFETRLFVERQWTAGDSTVVNTFSIANAIADKRFIPNALSERVDIAALSVNWVQTHTSSFGTTLQSALRAEGGTGTFEYGRAAFDLTASQPVSRFAASLHLSGGSSAGRVPFQRLWYMGGSRTVRGQIAGTQVGNSYWLARAELGTRQGAVRPVGFFDIGWAGSRNAIGRTQPQRGAGIGVSLLDGLFRIDVSRGLYPNKRWRTDLYLQAQL